MDELERNKRQKSEIGERGYRLKSWVYKVRTRTDDIRREISPVRPLTCFPGHRQQASKQTNKQTTSKNNTMGVNKITHVAGTGPQPEAGQTVIIEYTGWLKDSSQADGKGAEYVLFPFEKSCLIIPISGCYSVLITLSRFDSSIGRGDFVTQIGVGRLIRGMCPPSVHFSHISETLY